MGPSDPVFSSRDAGARSPQSEGRQTSAARWGIGLPGVRWPGRSQPPGAQADAALSAAMV